MLIIILILIILIIILLMYNNKYNKKESFGCGSGKSCCLPGYYGTSSATCNKCPESKPTSPFSHPGEDCRCKNESIDSCFACKNKCSPFNPNTGMCEEYRCKKNGTSCKVSKKTKEPECVYN